MYTTQNTLSFLVLFNGLLRSTLADSTMLAISEYPDGQPQAPGGQTSYPYDPSSSWTSSVSVTTSVSWPSSSYDNPFTIYTSMTNSLGVITGMPAVVTSQPTQPAVVTSQPVSPTLPSYSGYYYNTTSTTSGLSTLSTSTVPVSASNNGVFTTTPSRISSPTLAQATGAAVSNKVAGAGFGLMVAALGFSFL